MPALGSLASPGGVRRLPARIVPLAAAAAVFFAVAGAVRDDRAGRTALGWASPAVDAIVWAGGALFQSPRAAVAVIAVAVWAGLTLLGVRALRIRRPGHACDGLLLFAGGAAAAGQGALTLGSPLPGALLYLAAVGLTVASAVAGRRSAGAPGGRRAPATFSTAEAATLAAVTAAAALFRIWALNRLPATFDGELTLNMVASTSLRGALQYSYATDLTPSGLVYHLLMFAALRVCGTTLLAARLVAALAGVAAVALLYGLVRRIAGRVPATAAAVFLAASPIEIGWGRSELYPFGLPDLVVVSLCWATYLAVVEERWPWLAAVVLLQKLTYDTYPSGQLAFLIPVVVVAWRLVADRGFARRFWVGALLVAAGAVLWGLSLSLGSAAATGKWKWRSPFELNAGKTLWSLPRASGGMTTGAVAAAAWRNAGELARRIAVRVDQPTHYSRLLGMAGEPVRYLPGAVTALAAIGLAGLAASPRRKGGAVVLIWAVVAMLPGIMSTDPEARRVATLFPALATAAGIAAGDILRAGRAAAGDRGGRLLRVGVAPAALVGFAVVCGAFYLRQAPGVPDAVAMAQSIARHLSPGALVVADLDGNYDTRNRVTFLLLDRLREGEDPPVWRTAAAEDWPELSWRPRAEASQFQYASSFLAARASGFSRRERWSRCVWVVHDLPGNARKIELLNALYPTAKEVRERPVPDDHYFDFEVVEVAWDEVSALARPEERHEGGTLVHAALYTPEPAWASLRTSRPGVALTVDGRATVAGEEVLVARGVHEVVAQAGPGMAVPDMLVRGCASRSPRPLSARFLLSPALAGVGVLRARPAREGPGFRAQDDLGAVTKGVFTHVAVTPDGHFVALKIVSDGWLVEVLDRYGAVSARWACPSTGRAARDSSAVAIVGDRAVAVLDVDVVALFDLSGRPLGKLRLPFECAGEEDLAADGDGNLFVVSGALDHVARLPADGGPVERLAPPAGSVRGRWTPMRVVAARTGVVAAVDASGTIHLFGRSGAGWRWFRALDPAWSGRPTTIAGREDGWIVAYYPSVAEWRVFDGQGVERVALDPDHDLNGLLRPNIPVLAGFDHGGGLWAWFGETGTVARLAPREAPGASRRP